MRLVVVLALTALAAGCGGSEARFDDRVNATLRRRERARPGAGPRTADPDRRAGAGFERGLARAAMIARASREGDFPALRGEVDAANADFSRARTIAEQQGLDECALLGRVDR